MTRLVSTFAAIAYVALALPASAQSIPVKTFTLTLTDTEVQYIADTLQHMPYKDVAALLNKMNNQVTAQLNPPAEPSKPTETPPLPATKSGP